MSGNETVGGEFMGKKKLFFLRRKNRLIITFGWTDSEFFDV